MANRPRVTAIERMDRLGPELPEREADVIELYDRPGETLGLVGMGRIGGRLAEISRAAAR